MGLTKIPYTKFDKDVVHVPRLEARGGVPKRAAENAGPENEGPHITGSV